MVSAPFVSTFVALAIIPVAFLFVHAFVSGIRGRRYHYITGMVAVIWDLSLSISYMVYRAIGGAVEGSSLQLVNSAAIYFEVHGIVAVVVIFLEIGVLCTGVLRMREIRSAASKENANGVQGDLRLQYHGYARFHSWFAKPLFVLWWFAFLSGEIFYIVLYML
jgi:hypothetical protein